MKKYSVIHPVVAALGFLLFFASPLYAKEVRELYIAQGIQKMSEGMIRDALGFFEKALEASPGNAEAAYYSGMAYSRLGEFDKAEGIFKGILEKDKDFIDACLELGRIYYITAKCDEADSVLEKYVSMSDDGGLRKYASDMMQACRAEEDEGKGKKDYFINISLGSQYDDNVIVEPSDPASPADRKADFRELLYLAAGKHLFKKGVVSMKGDYSFYLSRHHNLSRFNVNYQKLGPAVEFDVSKTIKPSVAYSLGYTLIDGNLYSVNHKFSARVKVIEDKKSSTEAAYEYSLLKYFDSELFQTASIRDGYKHSAGIRQNYSDKFNAGLYFYYDSEDTDAAYWNYEGFRLGGDISSGILPSLYGSLSAEYSEREYDSISPGASEIRIDGIQTYSGSLTYVINRTFSLQLTESFTVNDSNLDLYNYRRNIAGLFLTAGVL
ncbi:MAG: tetratricopeptide repeat protein [Nitrospirae bacterium]|nr:tetratricopeptide repeat protein [Nitrospirota bacterium]